jgi:hypothetical protein
MINLQKRNHISLRKIEQIKILSNYQLQQTPQGQREKIARVSIRAR